MTKNTSYKRLILKLIGAIISIPIGLFAILAVLLYVPAIQNFAVRELSEEISGATGMDVHVERVRLAFPLTLSVQNVKVSQESDTLLMAETLKVDVALMPLFAGRADVEELRFQGVRLDTQSWVPDTRIVGDLGLLVAESRGVDWNEGFVNLNSAEIQDAQFCVTLSDTALADTTASAPMDWRIAIPQVALKNVSIGLSLPGDSIRAFATIGDAKLNRGDINLQRGDYGLQLLRLQNSALALSETKGDSAQSLAMQFEEFLSHRADSVYPNFTYLVDSLTLQLDSMAYRHDGTLFAQLCDVSLREQRGLKVADFATTCYMDSSHLSIPGLLLATQKSVVTASVFMPWESLQPNHEEAMRARIDGVVGHEDVVAIGEILDVPALKEVYPRVALQLSASAVGNVDWLQISHLEMMYPGMVTLNATGAVANLMVSSEEHHKESLNVGLDYDIKIGQMQPWMRQLGIVDTVAVVPSGAFAKGNIALRGDDVEGAIAVSAEQGVMTASFDCNLRKEKYQLSANLDRLPITAFLPQLAIKPVVAEVQAEGAGFDLLDARTRLQLNARVDSLNYDNIDLNAMQLSASLAEQLVNVKFSADNTCIIGEGTILGSLKDGYDIALQAVLDRLSLQQLAGAEKDVAVGSSIDFHFQSNATLDSIDTEGGLRYNHFDTPTQSVPMKDIVFNFSTDTDTTKAKVAAGDLSMQYGSKGFVSDIMPAITPLTDYIQASIEKLHIVHDSLKMLAPNLHLKLDAGQDNPLTNIMRATGYEFDTLSIDLTSAPLDGINGDFMLRRLQHGNLLLDEVTADIRHGKKGIVLNGSIHNHTRKNPNKFKLDLRAYLLESGAGADFQFKNKDGVPGFNIGCITKITEEGLNTRLYPENPIIAFRNFKINKNNYIYLGRNRNIKADVRLEADDGTGLQLYSEPSDSINDITLSLRQLNLRELSNVLPYLPKMGGWLNADLHVTDDHKSLAAMGSVITNQFEFEDAKLGDLGADVIYLPKNKDEHYACAYINSNGSDVMECNGTYFNSEEGFFEGEVLLIEFPMSIVNGFLQGTDILLGGIANGELNVAGPLSAPAIDGNISFGNAHIYSNAYNFDFVMDDKPIRFEDSELRINDFRLMSTGKEPLTLNGTLNLKDLNAAQMDFSLKGHNFELINAKRKPTSVTFGKLFVDVDCTLRGSADNIVVRGDLNVLNRTNLTYILKDTPLTVDNQLEGLVEFIDFEEDEVKTTEEIIPETKLDVSLGLGISDAAHFHCNLSEDGKSYVDVQGGGNLTMRMTQQGELRLIGRLTMEEGEMKYALPIIPLKTFKLEQGSYIEFTGDIMNPRMNIQAKERMKALVTEDEKQRSVAFDVGVAISKTLSDMGLEFTIEAPEDLSIQNQLATMTAAQRSKTAVSLMATGLYIAEGNMASGGFQASSALNAFLQSEIQNIAGSALQTVDINFGVENNTTSTGATTTDYSFQFSKRFFGDRFAINIGGRVSTGNEADNSAASIIDNVTLEYRLDKGATRYVQVFYDRSTFDPLEGQLSKMGGGIVLRKKTAKLGELFIFK